MDRKEKEEILHKAFFATVIINGCIALADIAVGFFFLFKQQVTAYLFFSSSALLNGLEATITSIIGEHQAMGMFYFFSHGIVKLILAWGLLTNRLWAYPFAILMLTAFTLYQLYDLFLNFSFFTLLLLVINIVTIYFISREYKKVIVQ